MLAKINARTARMLASARKDHSIPLIRTRSLLPTNAFIAFEDVVGSTMINRELSIFKLVKFPEH